MLDYDQNRCSKSTGYERGLQKALTPIGSSHQQMT